MSPSRQKWLLATLVYLAISVGFSWPLALHPFSLVVARHFDPFDAWWVAGRPLHAWLTAFSADSAWPVGQSLGKADSWVMVFVTVLLKPFVGPGGVLAALTLLGPVATALATQWSCERALGAKWPWSIVAGASFAFCGLAATAVLEGHVYMLFVPWLPLLAADLLAARDGSLAAGRRAGAWWALCLLTSAYTGMSATFMVAVLLLFGSAKGAPRPNARALSSFALVCALAGTAYAAGFLHNTSNFRVASADAQLSTVERWQSGSASLATLFGWYPTLDLVGHSVAPALGAVSIALAVVGVPSRGFRMLALLAAALSLGPTFRLVSGQGGFSWILSLFANAPGVEWFRFPVRLALVASLGLAMAAGASATRLGRRFPALTVPLVLAAALEPIFVFAMPWRTQTAPAELPKAYLAVPASWAVLDLYPRFEGRESDMDSYFGGVSCMYQTMHQHPILGRCLDTTLTGEPRAIVGSWLISLAIDFSNSSESLTSVQIGERLSDVGVGAVALHTDAFLPGDGDALSAGLSLWFGKPTISENGGERLEVFVVPSLPAQRPTREAALSAWTVFEPAS